MNMFKKNGGFTLVELIVVIAILAILAGVAVPVYSGYIAKAHEAADLTALDAVKTAAIFAYTEKLAADPAATNDQYTVTSISVTTTAVEVNDVDVTTEITTYTDFPIEFSSEKYAAGADWAAGAWTAATGE